MELTIEGNAYINGSFEKCCIGIDQGRITAVKKILKGDKHLDFGNRLILPGGIDVHVHFRDPGFTHKEDFSTGSQSAAFGGITCVFDMPNTRPQTVDISSLLEKIISAKKRSYVDFGIYAAITNNNIGSINDLSKYCDGFKLFLGKTTNSIQLSEGNLYKALKETSSSNKTVLIHAESEQCLKQYTDVGEKNLIDHLNSRPAKCEEMSIKNIIEISKTIKSKIHICHLSSCEGLEALRGRPGNVSVGVTPYHLLFDVSKIKTNQPLYKVNPPIRTNFDRESLWSGIKTGEINVLESDHAPHTLEEKNTEFDKAPSGLPGVETMFPLFLALVKKEKISFNRLIDLMCEKPAELTNIPKGKIEKGRDADFIIVDHKNICKIKSEMIHSKCGWTPFEGWPAIFPTHVFVRGERLIEDHEVIKNQGFGKHIGE